MSTALLNKEKFIEIASTLIYPYDLEPHTNTLKHDFYRAFNLNAFKDGYERLEIEVEKFIQSLMSSNTDAYNNRYEDDSNNVPDWISIKDFQIHKAYSNKCQLFKSLQCVRYNSDDCLKSKTKNTLNQIIETLEAHIISGLKEYKEADWF